MFFKFISKNVNVTWVIILHASVITAILKISRLSLVFFAANHGFIFLQNSLFSRNKLK